jgi:hypothetical protein
MLRRTTFFLYRDTASEGERLEMLQGLSYLLTECDGVVSADYGLDLLGGSQPLAETYPWKRTPRWHSRRQGPPSNHDVAYHLDFADAAGLAAYEADPRVDEVLRFNEGAIVPELTTEIDWRYEGEPLTRSSAVRHSGMFLWLDEADEAARTAAIDSLRKLGGEDEVESVVIGQGSGSARGDFDWIVDLQLADEAAARRVLEGEAYRAAIEAVATATRHEWTSRVTHVMRGRG